MNRLLTARTRNQALLAAAFSVSAVGSAFADDSDAGPTWTLLGPAVSWHSSSVGAIWHQEGSTAPVKCSGVFSDNLKMTTGGMLPCGSTQVPYTLSSTKGTVGGGGAFTEQSSSHGSDRIAACKFGAQTPAGPSFSCNTETRNFERHYDNNHLLGLGVEVSWKHGARTDSAILDVTDDSFQTPSYMVGYKASWLIAQTSALGGWTLDAGGAAFVWRRSVSDESRNITERKFVPVVLPVASLTSKSGLGVEMMLMPRICSHGFCPSDVNALGFQLKYVLR